MIRHNLLLLYRGILRAKSYFLINLTGLTAGLVCTLLIYLWVRDEVSVDYFHEQSDRIYQAMEHQQYADNIMTTNSTPGILSEALREEIPEVEYAATTSWINPFTLSVEDHNVKADGYYVGEEYFNIFSYPLLQGEAAQVLKDKSAIVISQDLAVRLFGTTENVLGKTVELQHKNLFKITGVFENIPAPSSYQFDFVLSFELFKDENEWVSEWGNNGPSTYVMLKEGSDVASVNEKIADFIKKKNEDSNVTLFLVPYTSRYLHGRYENGQQAGGRIEYVRVGA
jgi:hypothetical protein